jgi:hypothetical protein
LTIFLDQINNIISGDRTHQFCDGIGNNHHRVALPSTRSRAVGEAVSPQFVSHETRIRWRDVGSWIVRLPFISAMVTLAAVDDARLTV